LRSIEVDWSGANPVIYAITVTASSSNTLVKVTDTGASSAFTTLATSGPNQLFRGVRFGPIVPSLLMSVANGSPSPTEATLSFHGVPNSDYVLQRSCLNLSNWVDIATNTAAAGSGLIQNVITPDNVCSPAFYRTREK